MGRNPSLRSSSPRNLLTASLHGIAALLLIASLGACVVANDTEARFAKRRASIRDVTPDAMRMAARGEPNRVAETSVNYWAQDPAASQGSQPAATLPATSHPSTLPASQPTSAPASAPGSAPASAPAVATTASQPNAAPTSSTAANSAPANSAQANPNTGAVATNPAAPVVNTAAPNNPKTATPGPVAVQTQTQQPTPQQPAPDLVNPFLKFGPQIIVRGDGRVTRFFPVRADRGKFLQELTIKYVNLPAAQVELVLGADIQETRVTPYAQPTPPAKIPVSDWIAVTGTIEEVERVDRFINLFFTSVPQIEIEARIAEVTTSDLIDMGVKPTDPTKPMFAWSGNHFVQSANSNFPNASDSVEGLLSLQTVQSPLQFQATLELLAQRRDVDIISTPRIAVRNGGRAEIVNGNDIPYAEITTIVGGVPSSTIKYKQTGVKLFVTPYVAGSDTVLLSLEMELSIPTSVTETTFVSASPIIATRSAKTDVNIRDGNTFVVGGLISTNNLEQVSKVPILGDIPIVGLLFRSTQSQKQFTEVLFFITPRVIRDPATQGVIVPNP